MNRPCFHLILRAMRVARLGVRVLLAVGLACAGNAQTENDPAETPAKPNPVAPTGVEEAVPPPPAVTSTETNLMPEAETITAEQSWRSFLQIQGQLDTALLAIERNRRQTEAMTSANQKKVDEGLKSIEKVLQAQQEREVVTLRESNRNMLIVAGVFGGVGFLAMLLTSFFHFRAMNRLAGIAAVPPFQDAFALGPGTGAFPGMDEERLLARGQGHGAGQRLLTAIERLERRVHELEHGAPVAHEESASPTGGNGATDRAEAPKALETNASESVSPSLSMLLGKGQALLNLGKADQALNCFEDALALRPNDAETLLKKGTALEKLNRLEDAIACFDQAIAGNPSLTLAYLYKGGLLNRLERFDEALACYEQALKAQQHQPGAATSA